MNWRHLIAQAMAHQDEPSGKRGVWNVADLKLRCTVEPGTECWIWKGAFCDGQGRTCVLPWGGNPTTLGAAICMLVTGERPGKQTAWHPYRCSNQRCANPSHRKPMSRSEVQHLLKRPVSAVTCYRISMAKRKGGKLTDEAYNDIIHGGKTRYEAAKIHGISEQHVSRLRALKCRKPLPPMWAVGVMK